MTFKRFINRNYLHGDYGDSKVTANLDHAGAMSTDEFLQVLAPHWLSELKRQQNLWSLVLGDLRRLEKDTVDENYICAAISRQTGIDVNDVAAVLIAYMEMP